VVGGGVDAGPAEGGDAGDEGVALFVEDHFGCLAAGLGDDDAVAALGEGSPGAGAHGPGSGMCRSSPFRVPSLVRISTSTSVGSRPCWVAVRMTLPMTLAA
jgi:hypothetical protein